MKRSSGVLAVVLAVVGIVGMYVSIAFGFTAAFQGTGGSGAFIVLFVLAAIAAFVALVLGIVVAVRGRGTVRILGIVAIVLALIPGIFVLMLRLA